MEIVRSPFEMQSAALSWKREGKVIGLVPTMGFLHAGHRSLIHLAREPCDVLIATLFVNPAQFGPNEDLDRYPRDFARDEALCREAGVDVIFCPDADSMYADDASAWVDEEDLSAVLCGASRPGHFRGVCTVVSKLFNLTLPDLAVFGEKDAQQLRIIERMVRDLNFPVNIIRGPIIREADGLALSSRNNYLSERERVQAVCLSQALNAIKERFDAGERQVKSLREEGIAVLDKYSDATVEYLEFVDDAALLPVGQIDGDVLVALAVKMGRTRLIDNTVLHLQRSA